MNEYVCDWCFEVTHSHRELLNRPICNKCRNGRLVKGHKSQPSSTSPDCCTARVSAPGPSLDQVPQKPKKAYIVGSLRNPMIREAAKVLRDAGMEVFDDWHGCGPEADDHWKTYEKDRGRTYIQALGGKLAGHAFEFDKSNLDEADTVVLILPAGKSGHLELGYAAGRGKDTFIVLEPDRDEDRWDLMYKFATKVVTDIHGVPLYYAE